MLCDTLSNTYNIINIIYSQFIFAYSMAFLLHMIVLTCQLLPYGVSLRLLIGHVNDMCCFIAKEVSYNE